ncbi:MAG: beta-lactamase family protein [Oscillospiraceae bacterium]|nr:beta-lactamase family protein [Oscillospiraceae bacterium]
MDSLSQKIEALRRFFTEYIGKEGLPGVTVAVRQGGALVWEDAFGIRDDRGTPMTSDTIFGIASMSKGVTCAALAALEAEGKVSFMDRADKYIPGLRVKNIPPESLLIHHLATHSAGVPPLPLLAWSLANHVTEQELSPEESAKLDERRRESTSKVDSIQDIIGYLRDGDYQPLGQPGMYNSYSNDSFALLSAVVDNAAGTPLERVLRERIFEPLGMTRSILDQDASEAARLGTITELFDKKDGAFKSDTAWDIAPPYRGCGWIKSTAGDMARFYEALSFGGTVGGREVLPGANVLYGSRFAEPPHDSAYCYGLMKHPFRAGGREYCVVEHAGGLHGVATKGGFVKDGGGISAAVLCNWEDAAVSPLLAAVFSVMLGHPLDSSYYFWPEPDDEPIEPRAYTGRYHQDERFADDIVVEEQGGGLVSARAEGAKTLLHCGTTKFIAETPGKIRERWDQYQFFLDESGEAKRLRVGSRIYARMD